MIAGVPRTLVVTGHFPPEHGGVQTFTWEFVRRLPPDRVVVVAPSWPGAAEFDTGLDFPVLRRHGYLLFAGLADLVRRYRLQVGWLPAMAPFGLYGPLVRRAGVARLVASTHGQELGWIRALPTRIALHRLSRGFDAISYLSEATVAELRSAIDPSTPLVQLAGGVDAAQFDDPDGGAQIRRRYGLGSGPVAVSVSRLVRRKGQDRLLEAWPAVLARFPSARLLIVGDGPMRGKLAALAAAPELAGSVHVVGPVPAAELAGYYSAANVFALPCRDDRHGLQTEGLGLSTLEASAAGLPVVVGRSGGSPASLIEGRTGLLVDPEDATALADALLAVFTEPVLARRLGAQGRAWVRRHWTWDAAIEQLVALLRGDRPPDTGLAPDSGRAAAPITPARKQST
ncbi:MAG TPA: glycosyltransferase family 4 protein [Jatrophihabitans sp.]|nr:glycosyltransferase family 4 protein [Jatrophihabitans sp.]